MEKTGINIPGIENRYKVKFNEISNSKAITLVNRNEIVSHLNSFGGTLFSSDVDLVVFGSIARDECTNGSDIDWTLLIDGQADPYHYELGFLVKEGFSKMTLQKPGVTGLFGQLTYSHDLINCIGGEDDTNHNISRRILMLLESDKIEFKSSQSSRLTAYNRVISGIINQYILHDSGFSSDRGSKTKVPRFLLNDIVRFWRTMCVDFAFKQREQKGKKWALRNIKLRMSRKLIFVKGLLMCYSCYNNEKLNIESLKVHLREIVLQKPLEFILNILYTDSVPEKDILQILNSYNEFLGILNDEKKRQHLSELDMHNVYHDRQFMEARKICDEFQTALDKIFIESNSTLSKFIRKYGIF